MFSEFVLIAAYVAYAWQMQIKNFFYFSDGLMASHMLWEDDILSSQSFPSLLAVTWVYMRVLSPKFDVSKW